MLSFDSVAEAYGLIYHRPRPSGENFTFFYTVLQKYAHIGLNQNLSRSTTLDTIIRLLDNAVFACVHVVGSFSKDLSEVEGFNFRLNGGQQHYARNYEKKCNAYRTWKRTENVRF